jgi:hypothetical protein
LIDRITQIRHKRRVLKIRECLAIRLQVSHWPIGNVDLQLIAIRRDHRNSKRLIPIATRPVKRRLKDDLFLWIDLRLIKTGGWFANAKDISDPVIADAIAGTEI